MEDKFLNPVPVTGGYISLPKIFFHVKPCCDLSADAKLLFALLQDRVSLSVKNGERWQTRDGCPFVYFKLETAAKFLNCGIEKAGKCMKELEAAGLIRRQLQQYPRTYQIHVVRFQQAPEKQEYVSSEKHEDHLRKISSGSTGKSDTNNLNTNKPDSINYSETDFLFVRIIRQNIAYDDLLKDWDKPMLDGIIQLMDDTLSSPQSTVWIDAEPLPKELIRYKFLSINQEQMRSVLEQAKAKHCEIDQMVPFLLDCLYQAVTNPSPIDPTECP